ncbi:MAG: L-rhamnose mutarotase, partial [Thermoguttaceae bacterium]
MPRYGSVVRLRTDKVEEYKRLHASVWPEVLA